MNHDESYGEIFISPNNKMTAKYVLYGTDNEDALTEINVKQIENSSINAEIAIKVDEDYSKDTIIDIKYRGNSEVLTEIQPMGSNNVSTEIYVPPHNKMWARYEIQQPPKITDILNPKKDAFTREKNQFRSINYGKNNTLAVGRTEDDYYRSYIQFDFEDWESRFVIVESKLRLYYSGIIPPNSKLELLTVDQTWYELGITDLNRPSPKEFIVTEYINHPDKRYIEFKMTDIVIKWLEKTINNHGFLVRASNESTSSLISFKSRESSQPPQLLITYYDSRVFSTGRSQVLTEIFVWNAGNSDTLTEIEVGSVVRNNDIKTELYVHRYEVPVDSEHLVEITVSKPLTNTEITISTVDDSTISAEVSVRSNEMEDRVLSELSVSRECVYTEVYSKYGNIIDSELTIQRYDDDSTLTEIVITREMIQTELEVRHRNDILTEIDVKRDEDKDILVGLAVSREAVLSEISVSYREDIATEITVQKHENDSKEITITSSRPSVNTEIYVPHLNVKETEVTVQRHEDEEIETVLIVSIPTVETEIRIRALINEGMFTEITPRAIGEDTIETSIFITREEILTEITVVDFVTVEAEIYVRHRDDIETEINVTVHDSVESEIDVLQQSKLPVEITVTRPDVNTIITVPYWDDNDKHTEIEVRILKVDDISTEITVRTKGGAYAFII